MRNLTSIPSAIFSPIKFLRYKISWWVYQDLNAWAADNQIIESIAANLTYIETLRKDAEDLRSTCEDLVERMSDCESAVEDIQYDQELAKDKLDDFENDMTDFEDILDKLAVINFSKDIEELKALAYDCKKLHNNLNKAFIEVTRCWVQ